MAKSPRQLMQNILAQQSYHRGMITGIILFLLLVIGVLLAILYYRLHLGYSTSATLVSVPGDTAGVLMPHTPDSFASALLEIEAAKLKAEQDKARVRKQRIDRVEAFFKRYGAKLQGYAHIMVDQAEKCGGDYKILVGIAGSESGLGRVMYKKYNPYGYLNGVQYKSQKEALTYLSCKVSQQHIAPCGKDLQCLARRYAGPKDDLNHFVSKVRWFMEQI